MPSYSIGFWVASTRNGRLERVRAVVGGDLALLHGLQERGLRLRRGAVDLVAQEQVAEHWPRAELEARGALVEDRRASDVGGQQVGRELHAAEAKPGRGRERARDQRLRHPGHVLEQDVAVGQQCEQHELEDVALADHGALDLVEDRLGRGGDVARMGLGSSSQESLQVVEDGLQLVPAEARSERIVRARAIGPHQFPGPWAQQRAGGDRVGVEIDAPAPQASCCHLS